MNRIVRAELFHLLRRRTVLVALGTAVLFASVAVLTVFSSAKDAGVPSLRGGVTIADLAGPGGGTAAFATAASFSGFLVFVTFIALMAAEFSGGTFRSLVMREPGRTRVVAGKLVGVLVVAGGIVALAEACTFLLSLVAAPWQDVPVGEWYSARGLAEAGRDYLTTMSGVAGWAIFGTMLAVIFRSAPIALGVGFAWAGPFENITVDSWETGLEVFPGQVLAALVRGGTPALPIGRAVLTAAGYAALAAAVTLTLVARRDVTS